MSESKALNLSDFGVSPERGFLPKEDPLSSLPDELSFLNEFGNNLPELIESGKLRGEAKQLPIPSTNSLAFLREPELQLAWVRYCFIQSAYVYASEPVSSICPNIAIPVWTLSRMLGKPPILSYDAYTLNNWRRKNENGKIEIDNLELIQTFMRDPIQAWFILIHADIENLAGLAIRNVATAVLAAERRDTVALESALLNIDQSLGNILPVIKRMTEGTSPDTYHKIRRWIMSFKNVVYEGVPEFRGEGQSWNGQTGAMTSIFQAIEAGLETPPLKINELAVFLKKMREYMPRGHREFIWELETRSRVRRFIISSAPRLAEVYNSNVTKICDFLEIHFGYAFRYIFKQTDNPRGTGDSEFMTYLKDRLGERRENTYIKV